MKLWKALFVLSAAAAFAGFASADSQVAFDPTQAPAIDNDIIDKVNSGNFGWTAKSYSKFEGMSVADAASRFLRTMLPPSDPTSVPHVQYHAKDIPDSFDARDKWKSCIHPVRDQGQCGSCWAFGAAETLSDRFCIASDGDVDVVLSPQDMVSCDSSNFGCQGGYLDKAWKYLESTGIPTDDCYPYTSGSSGQTGQCKSGQCQNGDSWKVYKAKSGSTSHPTDEKSIQTEIMNNGPVEGGFTVYQDFFSYSSGVYQHKYGGMAGGHAIKILGWGNDSDSNLPYWIVANSWGQSWGMKGYFWILRGSDECGIEDQVYAGEPDL